MTYKARSLIIATLPLARDLKKVSASTPKPTARHVSLPLTKLFDEVATGTKVVLRDGEAI
ncbi:hypothetical protein NBRC116187_03140 [Halopseudomonas sabulinigri]|uniref:Uncharacterized protein n=1 Tax=Halopseudomonas sabulinigri TaxID=472181 RepID=A0ABP9ZKG6_9GAMM